MLPGTSHRSKVSVHLRPWAAGENDEKNNFIFEFLRTSFRFVLVLSFFHRNCPNDGQNYQGFQEQVLSTIVGKRRNVSSQFQLFFKIKFGKKIPAHS